MPFNYSIEYFNGSTYTALTGVQSMDLKWGRTTITDAWSSNTGTIVLKTPNYYASPITDLVPNVKIRIRTSPANNLVTEMYVSDIAVEYGIPYADYVGNADYVTLSLEGGFARLSRVQGDGFSIPVSTMSEQLSVASIETGVSIGFSFPTDEILAANTVSGSWGDWLNTFLVTTGSRMQDGGNPNVTSKYETGVGLNFSDTTNDVNNKIYSVLNFGSLADNFYTQITVTGNTLSPVTVQSGAAPYRSLNLNTISYTSDQATDLANYYLGSLNVTKVQPLSVSMLGEAQSFQNLDFFLFGKTAVRSNLTFRGTTVPVMLIGGTLSVTPERLLMTCNLSGFDNMNFFTLDNDTYGILGGTGIIYNTPMDYNELGYIYNDDYADNGSKLGY